LFTTPVVYLYFDRIRLWWENTHSAAARAWLSGEQSGLSQSGIGRR
jgi:hypothetical protein